MGDAIVSADWSVEPDPVEEWVFYYWDIDDERIIANPVEIMINGPHTVTPHARLKNAMQRLTVNPCPEWPGLVVNVEPAGYLYPTGTVVTLKAA